MLILIKVRRNYNTPHCQFITQYHTMMFPLGRIPCVYDPMKTKNCTLIQIIQNYQIKKTNNIGYNPKWVSHLLIKP